MHKYLLTKKMMMDPRHCSLYAPFFIFFLLITPISSAFDRRPDPLRSFKFYEGGYDLRNYHYWAATLFTGVHGYAIAGIWSLGGTSLAILYLVRRRRKSPTTRRSSSHSGSENSYSSYHACACNWHLILEFIIVVFTLLAIVASIGAMITSHSLHSNAKELEEIILGSAEDACDAIHRVLHATNEMHELLVMQPFSDDDKKNNKRTSFSTSLKIMFLSMKLRETLTAIGAHMQKDDRLFDTVLGLLYGTTLTVLPLNLACVIAAIVTLVWWWHPGFIMVTIICWILTSIFWVLTGLHFALLVLVEDTCSAMKELRENPSNNSLSMILSCPSPSYGDSIMADIGVGINDFINQFNSNVSVFIIVSGWEEQGNVTLRICNEISNSTKFDHHSSNCSSGSISIEELASVLENGEQFLLRYIGFIKGFMETLTDLQSLISCSFVKNASRHALTSHCKPLKLHSHMLWSSMVALSVSMVVLEFAWIAKAWQQRRSCFQLNNLFLGGV